MLMNFLISFFEANKLNVAFWTAIISVLFSFRSLFMEYKANRINVEIRVMQTLPLDIQSIGGCLHVFFLIANYSNKPVIIESVELVQGKKVLSPIRNGEKVITVPWNGGKETMYSIPFPYSINANSTITEYVTYHDYLTKGINFDMPVTARILVNHRKKLEIVINTWHWREDNPNRNMFGTLHYPEK